MKKSLTDVISTAKESYLDLRALEPRNELLRYGTIDKNSKFDFANTKLMLEFAERFRLTEEEAAELEKELEKLGGSDIFHNTIRQKYFIKYNAILNEAIRKIVPNY